jgi:hypothetical protein
MLCIKKAGSEQVVAAQVEIADTFLSRFRGLMLRPELPAGAGLLIQPCSQIHMMFMRFPIDAAFLDATNRVVALYAALAPWWGLSGWHRSAEKVVELPAGTLAQHGVAVGDQLMLIEQKVN